MAISIDLVYGKDAEIFDDLVQISRCDPGLSTYRQSYLGSGGGPPATLLTVTYAQKQGGVASSNRLLSLISSSHAIVIIGVDSTYVINGNPITTYFGLTLYDPSLQGQITIYVDTTAAAGAGYEVRASDNSMIDMPRPVVLYHELAHAHQVVTGVAPSDVLKSELMAQADENVFRAQLGLPLRSAWSHYGGTGQEPNQVPFPRCKPVYKGWEGCLIATAAAGSPDAVQVDVLRRARNKYRSLSRWVALISEPSLGSYARFSPQVVEDMKTDPALAEAILQYVVQPGFHLAGTVELYLDDERDEGSLTTKLDERLYRYVGGLSDTARDLLAVQAEAALLASMLLGSGGLADAVGCAPGCPFIYLARAAVSGGGETSGIAWALDGLGLLLRQAALTRTGAAPDLVRALGEWLARLPLPAEAQLDIKDARAREELQVLGLRLFKVGYVRELFARQLLARWPAVSAGELRLLLLELGYIGNGS